MGAIGILIFCNLIWSFNPIAGKKLLEAVTPLELAWLRYSSAALILIPAYLIRSYFDQTPKDPIKVSVRSAVLVFLMGLLSFGLGPVLQAMGLAQSQATDNAILVALEPLTTILLAAIFLRERLSQNSLSSILIAVPGVLLLSMPEGGARLSANGLIVLSMFCESFFSVAGRFLMVQGSALRIFTIALMLGGAILAGGIFWSGQRFLPEFTDPLQFFALLWLGPGGTALAYLLWLRILKRISASYSAISLFIQPLLGGVAGYWILNEGFKGLQWVGAGLILFSWVAHFRKPVLD